MGDFNVQEIERLANTRLGSVSLAQILRRPEAKYCDLPGRNERLSEDISCQVEISVKYEGYIERQDAEVEKLRIMDEKTIPHWIDYDSIPSLRTEARQTLNKIRPTTLGHASRISGVSPADVSLVMIWMKRGPQSNDSEKGCADDLDSVDKVDKVRE